MPSVGLRIGKPTLPEGLDVLESYYRNLLSGWDDISIRDILPLLTVIYTEEFIVVITDDSKNHHGNIGVECFSNVSDRSPCEEIEKPTP